MTKQTSDRKPRAPSAPRMTQPEAMKTKSYVYGVETLNGYDAWALFEACALGDVPKATALLAKDQRLVNAQFWYQFPIHMAVRAGRLEIVELLLDQGADPGQSRFTYNSWDKLLLCAQRARVSPGRVTAPAGDAKTVQLRARFRCAQRVDHRQGLAQDRRGIAAGADPGAEERRTWQ